MAENIKLPKGFRIIHTPQPEKSGIIDGTVATFDKGFTGGFGGKVGGLVNAIGSWPVDRVAGLMGVENTPTFGDRYNEIVQPAKQAEKQFHEDHPIAATTTEITGNIAGLGGLAYKAAGKVGLKGVSRLAGAGGIDSSVNAAGDADDVQEFVESAPGKTMEGVIGGAVIGKAGKALKGLFPKLVTKGKSTGLNNIVEDKDSFRIVRRGIQTSDDVAESVSNKLPEAYNNVNTEMEKALNKLTGRKLDIPGALDSQQERYNKFIANNANRELVDFGPTKEQIASFPAESKFNPNNYTKEQAQNVLKNRAEKSGIELGGDIDHYTKRSDRVKTVRTLSNTLESPDILYSMGNKGYVVKKYDINGKPSFDFVAKEGGKVKTKFPTTENYISNQLQKNPQNVSLSGRASGLRIGSTHDLRPLTNNNISYQNIVVNSKLPKLSAYTTDFNEFQKDALEKAFNKGAYMSNNAKGTLGATHRAQEVLNDMINKSYDTSQIGVKKATTETRQLMKVKERMTEILEPSGVKPYDAGISKAKSLEYFHDKGYNFKPSEMKFDNLGLKTNRDKRAFLQGRLDKILENVKTDQNLAKSIMEDENTLKKLMPERNFKKLIATAERLSSDYKKLQTLESKAGSKLGAPLPFERPKSEKWESIGSFSGSLVDRLANIAYGGANKRSAQYLLGDLTNNSGKSYLLDALQKAYYYGAPGIPATLQHD